MSTTATIKSFDEAKLNAFVGRMLGDMGATMNAALGVIGDRLGLYKMLAQIGPTDAASLAQATKTTERYVREWLSAQAAQGYITYDKTTAKFSLSPEQAMVFAEENSPAYLVGYFDIVSSMFRDEPKITDAFRSGRGVGWHEHDRCLFCGTERFFRPGYNQHLIGEWLPALDGVVDKLTRGAKVADVGCGHGASTVLMAKEFPNSKFFGFDYHSPSIDTASDAAIVAGVADRCTFSVATAKDFPGENYDLVCFFDCLHDMGDPAGAAAYVRKTLAENGTWMVVEPFAHDRLEDNINPVGSVFYAASTMVCTPASLAQEVGLALGAQAGEARLRDVIGQGGFSRIRRATETPFNMVLEARP
jgi:2-polyprenyl-3-methyl-5-hydroxy-6-metoxy-1,4-benzoquinol methylase